MVISDARNSKENCIGKWGIGAGCGYVCKSNFLNQFLFVGTIDGQIYIVQPWVRGVCICTRCRCCPGAPAKARQDKIGCTIEPISQSIICKYISGSCISKRMDTFTKLVPSVEKASTRNDPNFAGVVSVRSPVCVRCNNNALVPL